MCLRAKENPKQGVHSWCTPVPLVYCWTLTIVILTGCKREETNVANVDGESRPLFQAFGDNLACDNRCLAEYEPLVRASVGEDPKPLKSASLANVVKTMEDLKKENLAKSLSGPQTTELAELLLDIEKNSNIRGALVDDRGHIYLIIGRILETGKTMFQIVHGDSAIFLVSKDSLNLLPLQRAWKLSNAGAPIRLKIGSGSVSVDKLDHNFGIVQHNTNLNSVIHITNIGPNLLEIGPASTTCGCTTTGLAEIKGMAPGEHLSLNIKLQAPNSVSIRQIVRVPVFDKQSATLREFSFTLYGNQIHSAEISNRLIDYGTIVPGQIYHRTLTLTELETDRFNIIDVVMERLPLQYEISTFIGKGGLKTYHFKFALKVPLNYTSTMRKPIAIETSSLLKPIHKAEVNFNVEPLVTAEPSVLVLGEISLGQHIERDIVIAARGETLKEVIVLEKPSEVIIQQDKELPHKLIVVAEMSKAGVWQGVIRLRITGDGREDTISIPCSALVLDR